MMHLWQLIISWWRVGSSTRDKLITTIGSLAIVWYLICICVVGFTEPSRMESGGGALPRVVKWDEMRQFMSLSISMISGTLATYLGLVLGIAQSSDQGDGGTASTRTYKISMPQAIAAWAYVLSVVFAVIIWAIRSETYAVDPMIVNLGRSILGLFGGVLAVILNVEPMRSRT